MTKTIAVLFATLVVTALMPSKMALAQFSTAYVASNGTDTVGCGFRTSPCATFGKAISISFPGGTVRCVDQLGSGPVFSTVTITQSITLDCKGLGGNSDREGTDTGFVINGVGINVTLRGLNIATHEQSASPDPGPARIGIDIQQAATVMAKGGQ